MMNRTKKTNENATLGDVFAYVMTCYGVLIGAAVAYDHREQIADFVKGGVDKIREKKLKIEKK